MHYQGLSCKQLYGVPYGDGQLAKLVSIIGFLAVFQNLDSNFSRVAAFLHCKLIFFKLCAYSQVTYKKRKL